MTEDNTKEAERPSEENNSERDGPAETSANPADKNDDSAKSSIAEESAAQEDKQAEALSETAAADENGSEEIQTVEDFDLNLLLDIPLEVTVELGRTRIQIQQLLELEPGSAVTLSKLEGEPVDILANDKLIARGEVVLQNKKYGIRITEITSRMNRIKSLN